VCRRSGYAVAVVLFLLVAASAGGQPPRATAPPAGWYPNSWALVIGINDYQSPKVRKLNYAVKDAQAVAEVLPSVGFAPSRIRVLLNAEATKARIESVLYRDFTTMGEQDRLFVYFAGHGETAPLKRGEEGYLLPVDADPDALPLTAIPMEDIKRIGQRVHARHVLFAVDACFSGFALTRNTGSKSADVYLAALMKEPVVEVLTAGRKGELAIEEGGHGLFTRHLIKGLEGHADSEQRGVFTATRLYAWIEERVLRDSKGKMSPQYSKLDGEGQFVLLNPSVDPGSVRPRAARPEPSPGAAPDSLTRGLQPDRNIQDDVKQRLTAGGFQRLQVSVSPDGVVTLTGVLKTTADLERATGLAREVPGVRDVRPQVNVLSDWQKR
jgi:uncharacterized caspase-like protein